MDFAAAGLLDDLEGEEREARKKLLERLLDDGFEPEELEAAVAEDRLALLPVERVLGGRYSAHEIEDRTDLPARTLLRLRRILGLSEVGPDDRVFGDEDIEMAKATRTFLDLGLSEEALAEVTRVLGEAMARLAATTAAAFVEAFLEAGVNEYDLAMRFAGRAEDLTPTIEPVLTAAYTAHLREAVRRGMISRTERELGSLAGAQQMTVCFADLVGFTRLGNEVAPDQLGSVAGRLAEAASEVAEPPVRLVKTIGDAAMFVSSDAGALVSAALALCQAIEDAELPAVRAGLAHGAALQRAGDFYGHAVNLASRVTGIARPGSVLCTAEVHDAAPDDFSWSDAGRHKFKGVGDSVRLYRARPLEAQEDAKRPKEGRRRKRESS
jgi:adenylate cyclase